MAFRLAEAYVELSARGFARVETGIARIKSSLMSLGGVSSGLLGLTGLSVALYKSIAAAEEAEHAQRRLRATIAVMGEESGVTADRINEFAKSIAEMTGLFDDDAIAKASASMLEFGNITKGTFEKAIPIAVNLAARTGDLEGSFRTLGAALSNPAQNIGLLRRHFRFLGEDFFKSAEEMAKAGNLIDAQTLILEKTGSKTSGIAKTMATDLDKAKHSASELAESVGNLLAPAVAKAAQHFKTLADNARNSGDIWDWISLLTGGIAKTTKAPAGPKMSKAALDEWANADELAKVEEERKQKAQEKFLIDERAGKEKEREKILQDLLIQSMDKEYSVRAKLQQQLDEQVNKMRELLGTEKEIQQAEEMRAKALASFDLNARRSNLEKMIEGRKRETQEKGDIFRDLMLGAAPDKLRAKLELDFRSSELKKQIEEAFPFGDVRDSLMGFASELNALQQRELDMQQQQRKSPEFVGLTEMASRIQQAVGGGTTDVQQQQKDLLQRIRDKAEGTGLNVNIRNVKELERLGAVGA